MDNHQEQEVSKKIAQINKKLKLQPEYYPGQQGTGDQLMLALIFSPIIIVTSPFWIPIFLKGAAKKTVLDYKCSNVQKELLNQKKITLYKKDYNKIIGLALENMNKNYPIAILKNKSKESECFILTPKTERRKGQITRWDQIQKQFKDKKKLNKESTESMFFFAGTQLLNGRFVIEDIYNKWKSQDNILYVRYQILQVFG